MNAQSIANQLKDTDLTQLNPKHVSYIQPDEDDYFGSDYGDVEILSHITGNYYVALYENRMVIAVTVTVPDDNEAEILSMYELPIIKNRHFEAETRGYNYAVNPAIVAKLASVTADDNVLLKHETNTFVGWIRKVYGGYSVQTQGKPSTGVRDYDLHIRTLDDKSIVVLDDNITYAEIERKLIMLDALLQVSINA